MGWNEIRLMAIMIVLMLGMMIIPLLTLSRFYIKAAPGKALIVTGLGGMKATTGAGIMVYPVIHQYYFLDIETKTITFADEKIVVRVTNDLENILTAATAFGAKSPEETREVLQVLADSAHDDRELLTAKLAEIGYRVL